MRSVFLAAAICASAALAGCASIDQSLFGASGPSMAGNEPSTTPAPESPEDSDEAAQPAPSGAIAPAQPSETAASMAGTLPPVEGEPTAAPPSETPGVTASLPSANTSAAPATAAVAQAAPSASVVPIAPGPDTGTTVNRTIAGLRSNLQDVASRVAGAAQQLTNLRRSNAQQLTAYYQAQAQISARLQIGTTRANPELVSQWNAAQAALDQVTANVNALSTLVTQINGEVARTRGYLSQIQQTVSLPGAVDEDHRQLAVLEDEANQAIVVLDRLSRDATADIRRQAAALGTERTKLSQMAESIKAGDLYASGGSRAVSTAPAAPVSSVNLGSGGAPIVSIRFSRKNTNYQKQLYNALQQALQAQPSGSFNVVGVSPTRGSAAAVQAAQNEARRHAQDVMHTMTEMGVPATRMSISSATDPAARMSEVRVFLR
ncbi:MAG: hypothetical protein JO208_05230 [Alphaproteobacteria bacterium]|nr:hypothetical protein [Alphaproteobacteria bacterium]